MLGKGRVLEGGYVAGVALGGETESSKGWFLFNGKSW